MSNESIIAWLNSRAIEDSYLYELLAESQIRYGDNLLGISKKVMDKKRFLDLLRFADILSRSEKAQNRNISLKIISSCLSGRAGKSNSKKLIVLSESVSKFFISSRLLESEDE